MKGIFPMTVVADINQGWILDHQDHVRRLYASASLAPKPFFEILTPFRMDAEASKLASLEAARLAGNIPPSDLGGKRMKKVKNPAPDPEHGEKSSEECAWLRSVWDRSRPDSMPCSRYFLGPPDVETIRANNRGVRELVASLEAPQQSPLHPLGPLPDTAESTVMSVENLPTIRKIGDETYVIPPASRHLKGDVRNIGKALSGSPRFDVILLDPPWENKHVKRLKRRSGTTGSLNSYDYLSNEEISRIPVKSLLAGPRDGPSGLVLVWCTVSLRHREFVEDCLRTQWGCPNWTVWFWLKVTRSGEPITGGLCGRGDHKLPYEPLYLASPGPLPEELQGRRVIVSVPSALHSHKPPLDDLLKRQGILGPHSNCLEIFGRYLLPGWTTFGLEPLKLQNLKYFVTST